MERAEAQAIYKQGREAVVAVLLALSARLAAQDAQIAQLAARVAELEQRLNRNSRNSSLPPSQDPPGAPERRRAPTSERSQGAQPGHPGRGRHLAPIETLNELVDHWPSRCRCGHVFCTAERAALGAPARHQVAELPPTAVILSEHRLQRLRCPECGAVTRAALPAGVPPGAFGPRLQAAVATLAVRNRVSRRDTTELVRELFGAQLSSGSVEAIVSRASAALEEPYEDLLGHVRAAPAVNVDSGRLAPARRQAHASGGRSRAAPPSSASPRVATSARLRRCSARSSPAPPAFGSPQGCSQPGQSSARTLTARACLRVSARSRRSSARCSRRRRERAPVIAATAPSPRTS